LFERPEAKQMGKNEGGFAEAALLLLDREAIMR
jgi:hypothetical protein